MSILSRVVLFLFLSLFFVPGALAIHEQANLVEAYGEAVMSSLRANDESIVDGFWKENKDAVPSAISSYISIALTMDTQADVSKNMFEKATTLASEYMRKYKDKRPLVEIKTRYFESKIGEPTAEEIITISLLKLSGPLHHNWPPVG